MIENFVNKKTKEMARFTAYGLKNSRECMNRRKILAKNR